MKKSKAPRRWWIVIDGFGWGVTGPTRERAIAQAHYSGLNPKGLDIIRVEEVISKPRRKR